MDQARFAKVDAYIVEKLAPPDSALQAALDNNAEHGLPAIDVSPALGKFLHLIARMIGARKILEIGTLGGYSTIWLARAVADQGGKVVTLEADARHAKVAGENLKRAGLADVVDLRIGRALDTLPKLEAEGAGGFDLTFIDADKPNNPAYLEWALKLSRKGGVIIADNVIRDGAVVDAQSRNPTVHGVRTLFDRLSAEPRLSATALQTVGAKGWDGFAIALVD